MHLFSLPNSNPEDSLRTEFKTIFHHDWTEYLAEELQRGLISIIYILSVSQKDMIDVTFVCVCVCVCVCV